jgi:uncharacterized protein (TIRG00374 family)
MGNAGDGFTMKQRIVSLLQLLLGTAILLAIFHRLQRSGNLGNLTDALRQAADNWLLLCAGVAAFGFCILVAAIRWKLILDAQDFNIKFQRVLSLFFIGHFFNAFILGATGGDLVKAVYVCADAEDRRTEAVSTIFIDRLIGLVTMFMLVAVITLVRLPFFLAHPQTRITLVFNLAITIGTILVLIIGFREHVFEEWKLFRNLKERTKLGDIFGRVYTAFHMCLRHRGLLSRTIVLSLFNHVGFVFVAYFIGMALQLPLTFVDYLTVIPIIAVVAAVPITPSGIGTRETMTLFLFGALNVSEANAVTHSLLTYAVLIIWSFIAGLYYFCSIYLNKDR